MIRGVGKRGQNENLQSEIELESLDGEASEGNALLPRHQSEKQSLADVRPESMTTLFFAYLLVVGLPLATLTANFLFLALVSDVKVLDCVRSVASDALESPRYVKRAPPKPGPGFFAWVVAAAVCSVLNVFTLALAIFFHLRNYPMETGSASALGVLHEFVLERQLSKMSFENMTPGKLLLLMTSLGGSGVLLIISTSFAYWAGGGSKIALAAVVVALLPPLEIASSLLATISIHVWPALRWRLKHGVLQGCGALVLVILASGVVSFVSGPLIGALVGGQGWSSLQNLAVKVGVECGGEGAASQAYELLLDGMIRSGPSHDGSTTVRSPFEGARTPAVLRLAGEAFYVNAVDSAADPKSVPQWTVYSDEFWSVFHGGVSPNLLSFKASFWLRRSDLLASIHVPQAQDIHVAFPYSTNGAWESADVSLSLVHSNLRVLCPQVINGTREFSTRTFPTHLTELRKLELSVAMLGTYCPAERTMY